MGAQVGVYNGAQCVSCEVDTIFKYTNVAFLIDETCNMDYYIFFFNSWAKERDF